MNKTLSIIVLLLPISGCSNVILEMTEQQDWVAVAQHDVEFGKKQRTDDNLEELGAISSEAKEEYEDAYLAHVNFYCEPRKGYLAGRIGKPRNDVCFTTPNGWMYEQSWLSGRTSERL
ncbi:DUF2799 domain-containing protein [Enterovibrio makurazakiensis]|uniref:DUF2799 domain-containing protein n=1 Tax=Enterovibrio makurazakiensis TaxID=2910232 RepID=UPI003D24F4D6